jgi:hypothetical protein
MHRIYNSFCFLAHIWWAGSSGIISDSRSSARGLSSISWLLSRPVMCLLGCRLVFVNSGAVAFVHMLFKERKVSQLLHCYFIDITYHSSERIEIISPMTLVIGLFPSHCDIGQFSLRKTTVGYQSASPFSVEH